MSAPAAGPLSGRRVLVTRARAQADDLVERLEALGAEVLAYPTIRIVEPLDPEPLRAAVRAVESFHWIVFTSVNGVERFWAALRAGGRDAGSLSGVSLCAIGPATAAALELHGARADLMPAEHVAERVVEAMEAKVALRGKRILVPRPETAREVLPGALRARGAEVVEVVAYRTVPDAEGLRELAARLRRDDVDLLTFTASSTVRFFVDAVGADPGRAEVAAIGPVTAATARELGLPVHVEAEEYTVAGLLRAIQARYGSRGGA